MKEIRYFYVPDAASRQELPADEATHAVRVLRMKEGDNMVLMDGDGCFYDAVITLSSNHHCSYRVLSAWRQEPTWKGCLHIAVAPTKLMDRMEWLAEKATEIGIDKLTFLDCQFSERRVVKTERIEKIVVAAMKQSRKARKPRVEGPVAFRQFIGSHSTGLRFIAHCYNEIPRLNLFDELCQRMNDADFASNDQQEVIVMIGPEGDFTVDEVRMAVNAGFVSIDLGKSRLRTETAALAAVMMMQLAQQTITRNA